MEKNPQPILENAKRLFEKGNFNACKEQFEELLNKNCEPITCHLYLGVIDIKEKKYNDAEPHLLICLKSDPNNFNYLYYLGEIAEHQQNNDLAIHYYSKTLKIKPDHVNAITALKRLDTPFGGLTPETDPYHIETPLPHPSIEPKNEPVLPGNAEAERALKKLRTRRFFLGFLFLIALMSLSFYLYNYWLHYEGVLYKDRIRSSYWQDQFINVSRFSFVPIVAIIIFIIVIAFWGSKNIIQGDLEEAPQKDFTDLYEQLLLATDQASKTAIKNMEIIKIIKKKPNLNAFKGWTYRLCLIFSVLFVPVLMLILVAFFFLPLAPLLLLMPVFFISLLSWFRVYTIRRMVKHTEYTIDRGLIKARSGVFSRSYSVYWIHKTDHYRMHQNFWQLRTGECTLFFTSEGSGPVGLAGLGTPQEVQQLANQLESLRNQLRAVLNLRPGVYG